MSKNRALREAPPRGELVGLTRLGARACAILPDIITRLEAADPMVDYESCLVATSLRASICLHRIEDLAWGEIDDETMLAHARDILVADIRRRDATRLR
jgi:2-aminoethylphosphonate-pyruvate transaminase